MSKRILSLVLALVMVLGTFGAVFAETAETASEKIDWLVKQGIIQGTDKGLELENVVDRATMARLVAIALDEEEAANSLKALPSGFADMTPAHWANGYAALANGRGYMVGNEKHEFMPAKSITYAEVLSVLVRVSLGRDLTVAEKAGAIKWYTPYVAKAAELGIMDGVSIENVGAESVRKDVLEMLYNVLQGKDSARYDILKGIVLENSRVAKLNDNEIKIEIIEEVQRANYVDSSRKVKGEQRTLKLNDELEVSAEDLLGRVADFTFDKNGKLIEVKVDKSYELVTGALKATESRLGSYRVEVKERHDREEDADRTLFRTYYNNTDYAYEDYFTTPGNKGSDRTEDFTSDYVRATVKDGRVLFINAFDFEDIAPVKEVKKDGAEVLVYNDARDGAIKRYELTKNSVIVLVNDGVLSKGTFEDVKVDNVIHEYKGGYMVKQDKAVEGKFEKVSENSRGEVFVHVDGEEYLVGTDTSKKPVYQFEEAKEFYTLNAKDAHAELRDFRDEEVRVLTDLGGDLQYIGSSVDYGEFVGIATRIVGRDMRVVKTDNKSHDFEANLDTVVKDGKVTGHQGLNDIPKNSLVYVRATDKVLNKVVNLSKAAKEVTEFNAKKIAFGTDEYRVLDETIIFVVNGNVVEARTYKDVKYAFDNQEDTKKVEAYVVTDEEYQKETVRGLTGRRTEAHTIVFTTINMKSETTTKYAKFIGFDDRQETRMNIVLADGTRETVKLADADVIKDVKLNRNDVYELQETKTDDKVITSVKAVIDEDSAVYEVKSVRRDEITLDRVFNNGKDYIYETSKTKYFGKHSLVAGDKISIYSADNDEYATAILQRDKDAAVGGETTADGVVTYINSPADIKDGKLTLVTGFAKQTLDIEYKNDTKELAKLKDVKIYIPGKVDMIAVDVSVNPGETKALGLNLELETANLPAGKYEVKLLIDGKLQEETLEVIVLDNDNTVKEINVEGVKATGTAPTFSVQLPLGKKVEDVTVEASDITLNSTKATVIELKQATDKKSWTFKVEAEDGTKSAEQTLNLVETKINTVTVSLVDDKTVKVVVKDNQGTPAPVKGLKAADFEVTVTDGTVADGMDVESIVESNTEDGVYQIKLTKDLAAGNKVTVTVSEVVGTATK